MRAKRRDTNHQEIKRAFEKLGFHVGDAADNGNGFPDMVVCKHKIMAYVEVKNGKKKLRPQQEEFRKDVGERGLYFKVESMNDVVLVDREFMREWQLRMRGLIPKVDRYVGDA